MFGVGNGEGIRAGRAANGTGGIGKIIEGIVNALVIEVSNVFFHAFEVPSPSFSLHEAEEVALKWW